METLRTLATLTTGIVIGGLLTKIGKKLLGADGQKGESK